jgi:hypothetical protein
MAGFPSALMAAERSDVQIMTVVSVPVNEAHAPSRQDSESKTDATAKKSRAIERGFEVSNREASNRVTGVTRRNPLKDYKLAKYD